MTRLFVIRHAWAEPLGRGSDAERALTPEGAARWRKVAKRLVAVGVQPTIVAASPLVRARQTAEILRECCHAAGRELGALRPGGDWEEILAWSADQASPAALVGHCPDVEMLTAALIGDPGASVRFAKGAVAEIEFPGRPAFGAGMLCRLITAKTLGL